MKYLLSVIVFLSIAQNADAQGVSAGLRTGVGKTFDVTSLKDGAKHSYWEKQLFLRYETNGRLAFEINSTQYNYSYHEEPIIWECTFALPPHETIDIEVTHRNIDFGFSAQYDLSCSILREKCPIMKNFKSYMGIAGAVVLNERTEIYTNRDFSDGHVTKERSRYKYLGDIYLGINHTTIYTFGRFYLTGTATVTVNPWGLGSFAPKSYNENSRLCLRIGAGYSP